MMRVLTLPIGLWMHSARIGMPRSPRLTCRPRLFQVRIPETRVASGRRAVMSRTFGGGGGIASGAPQHPHPRFITHEVCNGFDGLAVEDFELVLRRRPVPSGLQGRPHPPDGAG